MQVLIAILLVAAVVFALLRAIGVTARIDFGWLAVACVIAAVWMIPAAHST